MFSLIDMLLMIMAEIVKPANFMICFMLLTLLAQDRIAGAKMVATRKLSQYDAICRAFK